MKILVGVKRVVDYAVRVRVANNTIDLSNIKMSMNPFCEIAVEQAVRMKESKQASEVIAVTIGPSKGGTETLRTALAMGCDRAIHITTEQRTDFLEVQPRAVSKIFQSLVQEEDPSLVLLGKQGIDSDCGQVGPMLAGMLGWPQITFAASMEGDSDKLTLDRETDAGTETLEVQLPSVVTCDLRLNEPRYATLPNIMKAKKKKVDVRDISTFADLDLEPHLQVLEITEPPPRQAGVMVESVDELVDKLQNEAKVI
mmetsp:Transcript_8468/g.12029  ORF Transcript_8468/g.12029 Transcript_8468/m.12029 type:complete len:255 (+) Transcript_8468:71-835(+)